MKKLNWIILTMIAIVAITLSGCTEKQNATTNAQASNDTHEDWEEVSHQLEVIHVEHGHLYKVDVGTGVALAYVPN